jgi:hypothetical protein
MSVCYIRLPQCTLKIFGIDSTSPAMMQNQFPDENFVPMNNQTGGKGDLTHLKFSAALVCMQDRFCPNIIELIKTMGVVRFEFLRHFILQTSKFVNKVIIAQVFFHLVRISFDDPRILKK